MGKKCSIVCYLVVDGVQLASEDQTKDICYCQLLHRNSEVGKKEEDIFTSHQCHLDVLFLLICISAIWLVLFT